MSDDSAAGNRPEPTKGAARTAGVLVGLEALGLAALAAWQVVALMAHDTESVVSAIALLVLTIVGVAVVAAFAVGVLQGRSWARSGAVVVQLLTIAVAGGAATGQYAHPLIAAVLAAPALVVLVLLIAASRGSSPRRPDDGN